MTYLSYGNPTLDIALGTMRFFAYGGVNFLGRNQVRSAFNRTSIANQYPNIFASSEQAVSASLRHDRISSRGNQFFPLPVMHKIMKSGDVIAFFRPLLCQKQGSPDEFHVELLLIWTTHDESAAFRFERGFRENDRHGYSHLQLSHSFKGGLPGLVRTSLPSGLNKYSPATPLPAVGFSTWFSMLLSLSGQGRETRMGLLQVFDELKQFGDAKSHDKAGKVLARIVLDLLNGEQFVPGIFCNIARNLRLP
jgi:hypothetical protein